MTGAAIATIFLATAAHRDVSATSASRPVRREPTRTVWDSVYSDSQAVRGDSLYKAGCARCHGAELKGGDEGSALAGEPLFLTWEGKTVGEMTEQVRLSMPPDNPKSLSRNQVSDVMAYVMAKNGFPAGPKPLPADVDSLKNIKLLQKHP